MLKASRYLVTIATILLLVVTFQTAETLQAKSITKDSHLYGEVDDRVIKITNLDSLKTYTPLYSGATAVMTYRSRNDDGGGGIFYFDSSDLSSEVLSDSQEGIYVPLNSDDTGASGAWVRIHDPGVFKLTWYGADPTGAADSGTAINAAIEAMRGYNTTQSRVYKKSATVSIDGVGGTYRTTISINATKLNGWNYQFRNFTIQGECIGKAVLDFTGSRGGRMENVTVVGDKTNKPAIGILHARSTETGYGHCDNWLHTGVTTMGYFTTAGLVQYGQETTHYDHGRYWNYDETAHVAILTGSDANTGAFSSDYTTVKTGAVSFINNKYTNCDFRALAAGRTFTISGVSQTNPAVVTTTVNHSFSKGDPVVIGLVRSGMTEISNRKFTVGTTTATTLELLGEDSRRYSAFTGSAAIYGANQEEAVYWCRGRQHIFDACYIVNYGEPQIQIDSADGLSSEMLHLNLLFEGFGAPSHIYFTGVGAGSVDMKLNQFMLDTYAIRPENALFDTDATTYTVEFYDSKISALRKHKSAITWPDFVKSGKESSFGFYGSRVSWGGGAQPISLAAFSGAWFDGSYSLQEITIDTLNILKKSSDPSDPPEGQTVIWMSDGKGSGDDGDIMLKITAGNTTKTITLVDFSAN